MSITPCRPKWKGTMTDRQRFVDQMHYKPVDRCFNREFGFWLDNFKQWDRFKDMPWGVLAHSTHLRGAGTYDAETGVERPRIKVTLATRIPPERCERVNLGYLDPAAVDLSEWENREAEGILVVPKAGETLYRLNNKSHAVRG